MSNNSMQIKLDELKTRIKDLEKKVKRSEYWRGEIEDRLLCLENGLNFNEIEKEAQQIRDAEYADQDSGIDLGVEIKYPDLNHRPMVTSYLPRPAPDVHGLIISKIEEKQTKDTDDDNG